MRSTNLALAIFLEFASAGQAHVSMLLPSTASVKKDEEVVLTYQWGHPFEHQLFDAPRPSKLVVLEPDPTRLAPLSRVTDLTTRLTRATRTGAEGKPVTVWELRYTPKARGDHVFLLTTANIFLKEENYFVQDTVKTILHVQSQQGWDSPVPDAIMQFLPLTRPYGLVPSMAVQALLPEAKGRDFLVEFERYNEKPPASLPPDELVTQTAKTDPNGVVTATVTDPGWWALTARRGTAADSLLFEGKQRIFHKRAILWLFVDEKPNAK